MVTPPGAPRFEGRVAIVTGGGTTAHRPGHAIRSWKESI
jgi:hypothetical protein